MGSTSQRLAGHAPPFELTHKGKKYHARMIDDEFLSALERKLYVRNLSSITPLREALEPEEYRRRINESQAKYLAGDFHLMSEESKDYFKTEGGLLFFLELLFNKPILELIPVLIEHKDEVIALFSTILHESIDVDLEPEPIAVGPKTPLSTAEIIAAGEPDPKNSPRQG